MPEIVFTAGERARIEKIASELDATIDEFFGDARTHVSVTQWESLTVYVRACVRRALEIGALLHAVVDAHDSPDTAYRGRGRNAFVRMGLAAWRDSFAPVSECWKLGPIFEAVPGGERRVLAEVSTLEVMAANRMFGTLDDQSATFLAEG